MIQCKRCGRKPWDDDGKVVLRRTNPKGKKGQFVCAAGTGCRASYLPGIRSNPRSN
jgi:hypothetical protein